jgi:hypothetical protein
VHYRLCLVTVHMKYCKVGDLSDFQRRQIVGARLASITKMVTLLGVSRAAVSNVMMTYTNHGKTSATSNRGQKPKLGNGSPYGEEDCV